MNLISGDRYVVQSPEGFNRRRPENRLKGEEERKKIEAIERESMNGRDPAKPTTDHPVSVTVDGLCPCSSGNGCG
ncbi:hypothetical protein HanPI659440_Chr11g0433811 [Helianthus annuus]|nr:hypothetical protein HanPI659440_Chr11g0433811 [Helianthus annuus]